MQQKLNKIPKIKYAFEYKTILLSILIFILGFGALSAIIGLVFTQIGLVASTITLITGIFITFLAVIIGGVLGAIGGVIGLSVREKESLMVEVD